MYSNNFDPPCYRYSCIHLYLKPVKINTPVKCDYKRCKLPSHEVPFPLNPGLQVQMYENSAFSQVAFA